MTARELKNYFKGQFQIPPTSGRDSSDITLERFSPSDLSEKIWQYHVCLDHVEKCINSAHESFSKWKSFEVAERRKHLDLFVKKLEEQKDELVETLSLENGQPLDTNRKELELVINQSPDLLDLYEKELKATDHSVSNPRGPAVLIGSFSHPFFFTQRFLLANLICGNPIVLKPSEKVSLTIEKIVSCLHQSEFPSGVINLIHGQGGGEVSRRLVKDKRFRVVFFTGSREVGLSLYELATTDLERAVSFSLSQKNICLLAPHFSEEKALTELINACYQSSGQDCTRTSLVFIPKENAQDFVEKFHQESKKLIIDQPKKNSFMGPLIDQQSADNFVLFMGMAKREGYEEIMRGKQLDRTPRGHFVSPSIHYSEQFKDKSHFLQENLLGPSVTFLAYGNFEEAISMANSIELPSLISLYGATESEIKLAQSSLDTSTLLVDKPTTAVLESLNTSLRVFDICRKKLCVVKN